MQKDIPATAVVDQPLAPEGPDLIAAGHRARVEQMFREHNESLLRFLRARLHSPEEARQVAQEAYVQMLGLDSPAGASFMQGYLFRAAGSIAAGRLKSGVTRQRNDELVFFHDTPAVQAGECEAAARQRLEQVTGALNRLPPLCRRAFILVRYEGMNFDAVAAELGVRPRTVRRLVQRAFASCQRALGS
jgi:RNA polymerase sigma-70 factor (ECF subfamily)